MTSSTEKRDQEVQPDKSNSKPSAAKHKGREHDLETQQSLVQKVAGIRWFWLGTSVALLGCTALVVVFGSQQIGSLQSSVAQATGQLDVDQNLARQVDSLRATLPQCVDMIRQRIALTESYKSELSTISAEYMKAWSQGYGRMNLGAYNEAMGIFNTRTSEIANLPVGDCDGP